LYGQLRIYSTVTNLNYFISVCVFFFTNLIRKLVKFFFPFYYACLIKFNIYKHFFFLLTFFIAHTDRKLFSISYVLAVVIINKFKYEIFCIEFHFIYVMSYIDCKSYHNVRPMIMHLIFCQKFLRSFSLGLLFWRTRIPIESIIQKCF